MASETLATVIGGAISLVSSLGAVWWAKHLESRTGARQLARAFKGEISALLLITRARNYEKLFRDSLMALRANNPSWSRVTIKVRQEYRLVYLQNASKLGSLKSDLPTQLASLYTLITALLEDFRNLEDWETEGRAPTDLKIVAGVYEEVADMIHQTLKLGDSTVQRIDELYK